MLSSSSETIGSLLRTHARGDPQFDLPRRHAGIDSNISRLRLSPSLQPGSWSGYWGSILSLSRSDTNAFRE
jgi:hypothetical protein